MKRNILVTDVVKELSVEKKILSKYKNFNFFKFDLENFELLNKIFKKNKFDYIFHLAAQAGVRYSIINPKKYIKSNINGFFNIIELSRHTKIKKFKTI